MKQIPFLLSVIFTAFLLGFTGVASSFACGTERWNIKVAQDQHVKYFFQRNDISTGKLQPVQKTTIEDLHNEPYPFASLRGFPPKWSYDLRAGQAEFRIWQITAFLTKKKNEDDEDYHLVIKDGDRYLVAEIPSETCVENTIEPLKSMILKARSDFDEWFAGQTRRTFNQKVRLTGLGFFDRVHGAEGASPNGIELHPVIKIEFLKR
jgi:hypothetical protein